MHACVYKCIYGIFTQSIIHLLHVDARVKVLNANQVDSISIVTPAHVFVFSVLSVLLLFLFGLLCVTIRL